MSAFDIAIERVLGHEGSYSNDPNDPGGETQWGISKRSYPNLDIAALTRDEAKEIYHRDFWLKVHADELHPAVAFHAFDFAVNSGINTAIRYLQYALYVADDGVWGPISRAAAKEQEATDTIMRLSAFRLDYMTRLSSWPHHGRGWVRRMANNLLYASEDT